jgi:hypothetical protein
MNQVDGSDYSEHSDFSEQVTESQLLFWKNNFIGLGYVADARLVNYEIIKLRRESMDPLSVEWVVTGLLGLPSGFGTKPYRPLWVSLIVVLAFSVLYWLGNAFAKDKEDEGDGKARSNKPARPVRPSFFFSLLYSIDTFVPLVAVTGVKEWGWKTSDEYRWIEVSERIFGLVLFGAAAYSVGTYVI